MSKTCPNCAVPFEVPLSNTNRYTYCSRKCSSEARGRRAECDRCGAAFRHGRTTPRKYCSEACRRPPVTISCAHCDGTFRIVPSAMSRKRYCSIRCYRASRAETGIERRVRQTLGRLGYVYRGQAQVGPWVVDFLVGDGLILEADGSYWHSLRPEVDRRKTADLISRGYTVWRLPEDAINASVFPAQLERRLADHEVAHGEIARVPPEES